MTSHALYSWHQMHYIWHVIYCVSYHIHYMCDIAQCLYVWHHTLYGYDISTLYGITHSVMTTQPLCLTSHQVYLCHHMPCTNFIKPSVCMTSQPLYIYDKVCTTYDNTSTLYDITRLYLWHESLYIWNHIHYTWPHVHCICVITPTLPMISQPLYVWYHIQYMCDILSTWFKTSYSVYDITTLCFDDTTLGICMTSLAPQMTSHYLYHTKLRYLWYHIYFRHDITPTVSDITHTVSFSSQSLHWYHTHVCMTSYSLYTTSHHSLCHHTTYLWHHSLYIWNHIQYVGQHIHYTLDIIATNLCHHTHSIDIITPTLCMTSHSAYEWQILHYTRHHMLILWHQTTVFMTSHRLYLRLYPLYLCNHVHCIDDISPTVSIRSHPLYMTSYPLYTPSQTMHVCHHTHTFDDITPFVCRTSHPLYV